MAAGGAVTLDLALQGGGAHGAFTWGVLERLLEEDGLTIGAMSGTSSGAVNAVLVADGLARAGPDGARESLERFWTGLGNSEGFRLGSIPRRLEFLLNRFDTLSPVFLNALLGLSRFVTPYQLNPLRLNPMKALLRRCVDFRRLRRASPVKLHIGATSANSGSLRLFRETEMSEEVLLASACLPAFQHTVRIRGEPYWDGAFSANPPLLPLVEHGEADDLLMVLVMPVSARVRLSDPGQVWARVTELGFNAGFLRELRSMALVHRALRPEEQLSGTLARRLGALRFHLLEAEDLLGRFPTSSKLNTRASFLEYLREQGRKRAQRWLNRHRGDLGRRSSVDLERLPT